MTRGEVAEYLLAVLGWEGFTSEKGVLVDAYLSALTAGDTCPVYTKNVSELMKQGVEVPDPLPC